MALVKVNWEPADRQLRQFSAISFVAIPLLAWIWSGQNPTAVAVAAALAFVIGGVGVAVPRLMKPVFIGLTLVTIPIGIVMGEVAMLLIYGGLLVPIGLYFRLTGRDSLRLSRQREAQSYWLPKRQAPNAVSYYRQF